MLRIWLPCFGPVTLAFLGLQACGLGGAGGDERAESDACVDSIQAVEVGSREKEEIRRRILDLTAEQREDRIAALHALQRHGRYVRAYAGHLRRCLLDGDREVRIECAQLLGAIGLASEATVDVLLDGLEDPDPLCRSVCAGSLGESGAFGKRALMALIDHLARDQAPGVRVCAASALERLLLWPDGSVPALIAALRTDPSAGVRLQAAAALEAFGRRAAPWVAEVAALDDGDAAVRAMITRAIEKLNSADEGRR